MTDAEVLAATTNPRLRELLTAGPHYRPEYWRVARRLAGLPDTRAARPSPSPAKAALWRAVRDCPHRELCGCQAPRCAANKGDVEGGARATYARCLACVSGGL